MAAMQSFVPLQSGSWIPLCQYREARNSLVVQIASGRMIISMNTNAPLITDPTFGAVPAGFANALDASGVPEFRLSRALNGDAVIQEWYGQLQAPLPPTPPPISGQFFQIGANPTTAIIGGASAAVLVVFAVTVGASAVLPTLTSAAIGPVPPTATKNLTCTDGATAILAMYRLPYAGAGDTLTLTVGGLLNLMGFVYAINGVAPDVGATAQGNGASGTLTASGPVAQIGETAVVCVLSDLPSTLNSWGAPWDNSGAAQQIGDGAGGSVTMDLSFLITTGMTIPPAVITFAAGVSTYVGILQAFTLPALPTSSSIATVLESFDDTDPAKPDGSTPPGKPTQISYFDVPLPKLSPDAIAALRDLQSRLLIAPGSTDTNAE